MIDVDLVGLMGLFHELPYKRSKPGGRLWGLFPEILLHKRIEIVSPDLADYGQNSPIRQ